MGEILGWALVIAMFGLLLVMTITLVAWLGGDLE